MEAAKGFHTCIIVLIHIDGITSYSNDKMNDRINDIGKNFVMQRFIFLFLSGQKHTK